MGDVSSTPKPKIDASTAAPMTRSYPNKEHLILAFFAGVLLTLLLVALIFFIVKCCRKRHSSPQTQDPHPDPAVRVASRDTFSL
ncbi:transmembrane protein C1orf162 homolog isoform X4 [Fukomys damarensis]|uniref:transmembrane protein C1orf162 homolog isoform X4 n=1 Tax=Fukomys damarensis TaxID=885580 RepID=UPI0008FF3C1B|nr:transmembrane protein C1orf162 homolog isoform X4 [Fukomys damarensis]